MPLILPHRLYFIRHGETDWNRESRLQGQKDIPINGRGVDQAQAIGRKLKHYLLKQGYDAACIAKLHYVASPLERTRQTMRLARTAMDLAPDDFACDARLMEISFGAWEGLTWGDVKKTLPDAAKAREQGKWDFQPPQGESYAQLAQRITPWLEALNAETVVVSHGGVARALLTLLTDLAPHTAASVDIWQGRALIFEDGRAHWL